MTREQDDKDEDLSALIRQHATRHRADAELKSAVSAELAVASAASASRLAPVRVLRAGRWGWLGGGFAGGALAMLTLVAVLNHGDAQRKLEGEIVASHVRALMADHLSDVISTDQHTVKPWFQGKLSYSPPVRDFSAQGFPLIGGRLDYVDGQRVAAIVYRHGKHNINVFIWPGEVSATPMPFTQQGFNVRCWNAVGMQFWAVSDVNPADLKTLQTLWQTP